MFLNYQNISSQQLQSITEQLSQGTQLLTATTHYLETLYKKTIIGLQKNTQSQRSNRKLSLYFKFWAQITKIQKIKKNLNQKWVLHSLKDNFTMQRWRKGLHLKKQVADNFYEQKLKRKCLNSFSLQARNNKKIKQVEKNIKKKSISHFISKMQVVLANKNAHGIVDSIYNNNLIKRSFKNWSIHSKIQKINKMRQKNIFSEIITKIKAQIIDQYQLPLYHYQFSSMKKIFTHFKQNYQQKVAINHHKTQTLRKCFNFWCCNLKQLFYEKQNEQMVELTVEEYINRKNRVKMMYLFQKWRNLTEESQESRNKNRIAREYAKIKEKQRLLTKYFQILKSLKSYNKAQSHYKTKLKQKVLEKLKQICIASTRKWDRIYQFVQNRQKRKYFNAIKAFNETQRQKIKMFREIKYFRLFCITIVREYVRKMQAATQYHQKSLQFRAIFALKKQVDLSHKTNLAIIHLNARLPLQRWRTNYRVREYCQARKYFIKKKIFGQLKLSAFLKTSIKHYNQHTFKSDNENSPSQFIQIQTTAHKKQKFFDQDRNDYHQTEFQKLIVQSPERMFSLQLSYSAYNSNENPLY